jgi:hypothetical protein
MKCVFNALSISDDDFNHWDFGKAAGLSSSGLSFDEKAPPSAASAAPLGI